MGDLIVQPEEVALMCLSAALVVPPGAEAGWGVGFDSQAAQAALADFLLDRLLDDESPEYLSLGDLVISLIRDLGRPGGVLAMSMLTTMGAVLVPDDISSIFESFQSLLVSCGTAPVDITVQCIAGIDPYSAMGMHIRRACAAFKADSCEGRAALVRRMHAAMGACAARLEGAVRAAAPAASALLAGAAAGAGAPAAAAAAALEDLGVVRRGAAISDRDLEASMQALECCRSIAAAAVQRAAQAERDALGAAARGPWGQPAATAAAAGSGDADGGASGGAPGALRSSDQLGLYLLAQTESAAARPPGAPPARDPALGRLRSARPRLPQLRYLGMLEALKARDAAACARELHLYFDSVSGGGAAGGGGAGGPAAGAAAAATAAAGAAAGEAAKGRCQSALLSLSSAHAELGHTQESLRALQAALRLAQQQGDTWAMVHSLAALCRVLLASNGVMAAPAAAAEAAAAAAAAGADEAGAGEGAAAGGLDLAAVQEQLQCLELLRRCLKIACQQQCPHIAAFARLAIARFALQHASAPPQGAPGAAPGGGGAGGAEAVCPTSAQVQGALRDACALQHAAALAAASPPPPPPAPAAPPPPGAPQRPHAGELYNPSSAFGPDARGSLRASARACAQAAGAAHLLQAAAWHQFGASGLAAAHALAQLACYGGGCGGGGGDAAAAWAQLVTLALEQQGPAAADAVLAEASRPFPLELPKPLAAARARMMHARAVQQRDARGAELWLSELLSTAEPGAGLDRDIKLDAALRRAEALAAAGALAAAHGAAAGAFKEATGAGMQAEAARALLQMGELHLAAGDPSGALPYALSAALHCQQLFLSRLQPRAALLSARAWRALSPAGARGGAAARRMLRAALAGALAGRDLEAVGKLRIALAEVDLSEAECVDDSEVAGGDGKGEGAEARRRRRRRTRCEGAAAALEAGAGALELAGARRGARDAWALLAVLRNARGEEGARDAAAERAAACEHGPWGLEALALP